MKITSKKHFIAYSLNIFLLILSIRYFSNFISVESEITNNNTGASIIARVLGAVAIPIFIYTILNFLSKKKTSWVFEDDYLTTKSGWLPWKKENFTVDIDQVYEAYYSTSLLGNIFGYGGITVRRTDGVTSSLFQKTMTNHKEMVGAINKSLKEHKASSKELDKPIEIRTESSLAEELKKLSNLKKEGIISEEEFLDLKKKNIQKFS